MPRGQGTVRSTARSSDEAMKPTPPDDLWTKLDAACADMVRPADTFTASEYGKHGGLTTEAARHRLNKLVEKGKVETGKFGGRQWYRLKGA
jgi:hypothetical protein